MEHHGTEGLADLDKVVGEVLSEKATFEQRPGSEGSAMEGSGGTVFQAERLASTEALR